MRLRRALVGTLLAAVAVPAAAQAADYGGGTAIEERREVEAPAHDRDRAHP